MKKIIRSARKFYQAKIDSEADFKVRSKSRPLLLPAVDTIVDKYFDKAILNMHGVSQISMSNYLAAFVQPVSLSNEIKAMVGKESTLPENYVTRMKEVKKLSEVAHELCYKKFNVHNFETFVKVPENLLVFELFMRKSFMAITVIEGKEI